MTGDFVIADSFELNDARCAILRAFEKATFTQSGDCFISEGGSLDISIQNLDPCPLITFAFRHQLTSDQLRALADYLDAVETSGEFAPDA